MYICIISFILSPPFTDTLLSKFFSDFMYFWALLHLIRFACMSMDGKFFSWKGQLTSGYTTENFISLSPQKPWTTYKLLLWGVEVSQTLPYPRGTVDGPTVPCGKHCCVGPMGAQAISGRGDSVESIPTHLLTLTFFLFPSPQCSLSLKGGDACYKCLV